MKTDLVIEKAHEVGFELAGVTRAMPLPDKDFFSQWLSRGYAGTMEYLKRQEEKRGRPDLILPGVQSIICCGLQYYQEKSSPLISRYALGKDYHQVVLEKLQQIESWLREKFPQAQTKSYADTGAIFEKAYAARAGLGWIGKNTCLINNGLGSYFFIGEILTTLTFDDVEYEKSTAMNQCGSCTKCLDACPTQAFVEPYVMDARKCISYLTIEYRGEFSETDSTHGHLYGCDICQTVCPYNDRIPETHTKEFIANPKLLEMTLEDAEKLSEEEFKTLIHESAMSRIKYPQWKRNLNHVRKAGQKKN